MESARVAVASLTLGRSFLASYRTHLFPACFWDALLLCYSGLSFLFFSFSFSADHFLSLTSALGSPLTGRSPFFLHAALFRSQRDAAASWVRLLPFLFQPLTDPPPFDTSHLLRRLFVTRRLVTPLPTCRCFVVALNECRWRMTWMDVVLQV